MSGKRKSYRVVRTTNAAGEVVEYAYDRETKKRLASVPGSREIDIEVSRVRQDARAIASGARNSWGDLIRRYKTSQLYKNLAPKSKLLYERYGIGLVLDIENDVVKETKRSTIIEMRDDLMDTPGASSTFLKFVKLILNFAIHIEFDGIEYNVALKIEAPKLGEHQPWVLSDVKKFLEGTTPKLRLAVLIALYTGQRIGDILKMKWSDYDGAGIVVKQQKTKVQLYIPCHSVLKKALDEARQGPLINLTYILSTKTGKQFTYNNFSWLWIRERHRLGMIENTFHGLRKTAAVWLAEAGCTTKEIAAITGHSTLAMIEYYTKGVDQKLLAISAMARMDADKAVDDTAYEEIVSLSNEALAILGLSPKQIEAIIGLQSKQESKNV